MRALLLALLLFAAPAIAEAPAAMSFTGDAGDAILTREPCTRAELALGLVALGVEPPFYAGVGISKDKTATIQLCWGEHKQRVEVYDETGDFGFIELDQLKPVLPI